MKRIATLFTLITMSVIMNAQTRGDFFAFVDSFNWKLSKEQFEEKYASRILPKTDSLVTSLSYDCPYYVLNDLSIGEYDCTTVVIFEDGWSSPFIYSAIPPVIILQHMQSVLSARLDKIEKEKMGIPDKSEENVDYSTLGFPAGTKSTVKHWIKDTYSICSTKTETEYGPMYSLFARKEASIQDTFFGLKMTDRITSAQIKSAIGARGVFVEETRESNSINYLFKDVYFAGSKWDIANIICTSDGKFYWFRAYNVYDGYSSNQKKNARDLYDNFKKKLDDKYGNGKEQKDEDENINTTYLGSNDMGVIIYYERLKSFGDFYKRYLKIEYFNVTLFNNQMLTNDDEL